MKLTFIGIGVQKCASTWLDRMLEENPAVGVEKGIDYFSFRWMRG